MNNTNTNTKTIIAEDVEITGSIKCASSIQLDGKLNGDINCSGNATLGTSANVKGNITVESITVNGQINGNITAKDRIELKASAKVIGDIRAKRLTVEDGVSFVGKSEVNPSGTSTAKTHIDSPSSAQEIVPDEDNKERSSGLFGKK